MNQDPTLAIAQYVWKTREMMRCAALIAAVAARSPGEFWLDEIDFSDIGREDRNCIGNTVKSLIGLKLIRKTGAWRASTAAGRKGSTTFAYEVQSVALLRALLRRLEPELERHSNPQPELALA